MNVRYILGGALIATGCHAGQPANKPVTELRPDVRASETSDAESVVVSAEVGGDARVRYSPELLEARGPIVKIAVENRGRAPVDVSNLRVRLDASRDGVPFPCSPEVGPEPRSREKSELPPGGAATFERRLDCALPLVGTYVVQIVVALGKSGPWHAGRSVRSLSLRVVSPPDRQPRSLGSPGLWAAVGSSAVVGASAGDAPSKVAVAIVNGGASAVVAPPLRMALRVYRRGTAIPCEDQPHALELPPTLLPGRSYVQLVAVSCLGLGTPGHYEIAPRILVPASIEREALEVELGRVQVEVSSDPSIFDRTSLGR